MDYLQVNIDDNKLKTLGFNDKEINEYKYVYYNGGKLTSQALQSYGYNYGQTQRLMYIHKICSGKTQVDSKQETIKHFKKMFGNGYKISIQDLVTSKVTSVPRVAVVANITDEPYNIWNSNRYKGKNALYKVVDTTGQNITVETNKKPVLEYNKPKKLPGILEIKGVKANGNAIVSFNKDYCRLCNRFVILASLRNPEFHHGKYEIICFEGTKVYIYAANIGTRDAVRYSGGNQRVYDYGIFPQDIKGKLNNVAKGMYRYLKGVRVDYFEPNKEYVILDKEEKKEDINDGVII